MDRLISAVNAFLGTIFVLVVATAITESATAVRITLLGSRAGLLYAGLVLAILAAWLRFRTVRGGSAARPAKSPDRRPSRGAQAEAARTASANAALDRALAALQPAAAPTAGASAQSPVVDPAILAAASQAIVFRQYFPPLHDDRHRSFFGGLPVAPADFAWPRAARGDSQPKPLHFVMQIDCAEVPAAAGLGLLPQHGVLHFFLDLEWGKGGCRVIYSSGSEGNWTEAAIPDDLGPAYGEAALYHWPWATAIAHCPITLPRWPFEPVAVAFDTLAAESADSHAGEQPREWSEIVGREAQIVAAQGAPVALQSFSVRDFTAIDGTIQRPFPNYPHDWRSIQIVSAQMLKTIADRRNDRHDRRYKDMPATERVAFFDAMAAEAQGWFEAAWRQAPFAAVPEDRRDRCWQWLTDRHDLSMLLLPEALTLAIEASLAASPEAAARVPARVAERLHARHALAVQGGSGVHVNTPDRMLALASDVQGNQLDRAATHLLLLELSSDEGLGHFFGEGVYQLWITPEDLQARRFDRVALTTDAY